MTGDIVTVPKNTPGPTYDIPEVTNYKFEKSHKWKIGNAKRPPLNNKEKFAYYNHVYRKEDDLGALPKHSSNSISQGPNELSGPTIKSRSICLGSSSGKLCK